MNKCTVQIVDVSHGFEVHVRKLTFTVHPHVVLEELLKMFDGHLVTAKKAENSAQIAAKKSVQPKSSGQAKK